MQAPENQRSTNPASHRNDPEAVILGNRSGETRAKGPAASFGRASPVRYR